MPPESSTDDKIPMESFSINYNALLDELWRPRESTFGFQMDGVLFQIKISPQERSVLLTIESDIGYIPFTAESAERRRILKKILEHTSRLTLARFTQDREGKISVHGLFTLQDSNTPELNLAHIVIFIHQTMPYIRLIGMLL